MFHLEQSLTSSPSEQDYIHHTKLPEHIHTKQIAYTSKHILLVLAELVSHPLLPELNHSTSKHRFRDMSTMSSASNSSARSTIALLRERALAMLCPPLPRANINQKYEIDIDYNDFGEFSNTVLTEFDAIGLAYGTVGRAVPRHALHRPCKPHGHPDRQGRVVFGSYFQEG